MNLIAARKVVSHRLEDEIKCLGRFWFKRERLNAIVLTEAATVVSERTPNAAEMALMISLKSGLLKKDKVQLSEILQAYNENMGAGK